MRVEHGAFEAAPGKSVQWDPRFRRFCLDRRLPLRGVTPTIARYFCPRYSSSSARKGPLTARGDARVLAAVGINGRELGSLVDSEVTQLTRLAWKHALTWDHLLPDAQGVYRGVLPVGMEAANAAKLRHIQLNGNLYTRRLLQALRARHLFPVASQVPVGSAKARLGTAVDLVCVHEDDLLRWADGCSLRPGARVVLVELKCGYETNYERYVGPMEAPLQRLNDSPHEQHQVQLLLTRILFERTFTRDGGPRVHDAFVVRVHAAGVTIVPTMHWTSEQQWEVFRVMESTCQRTPVPAGATSHKRKRRTAAK